jgi:ABC-type sugar transport system ATPase subunit
MEKEIIYSIKNITKKFPGVTALDNVSIDIEKGEILAVVGENGAGKSTLMNMLFGVYPPTSGDLIFEGQSLLPFDTVKAQNKGIAMIHQELSLSNALSIAENIFVGRLPKNRFGFVDKEKLYADSKILMREVGLGDVDPRTLVREINVSQQQQVEIAKALSLNAKLLILDEPTSSLTISEAEALHEIMGNLKAKGITMLYISHKLDEIMKISDRIVVFRDGQHVSTMETKNTTIDAMITSMVGREYAAGYSRAHYKTDYHDDIIMEVKNLNIEHKVHDVSFKLHRGEILGITGLVGAGRSEVLQAVFGADKKKSGTVYIEGKEVDIKHPMQAIAHGVGLIPEGRKLQSLFLKFSVKENITIVGLRQALGAAKLLNRGKEYRLADDYSKRLRIKTPSLDQKIVNLSGGNQQKAVIARWLLNNPKILFLDEPTQGIDIGAKNEIYSIIEELAANGVSVVVVSSEMQETIGLCDRVLVMYEGRITGELSHAEISQEVLMTYMSGK